MSRAVKVKQNVKGGGEPPAKTKAVAVKKSKLYAMPEKIEEGTVLSDLSKTQWRVGPSIGIGGFGEIYSACRVGEKNYDFVVKCEPHGNGPLFVEMHFYMRNARLEDIERFKRQHELKALGMPYMIGNGSMDIKGQKHRFIVMPRYGSDIALPFVKNGFRLPEGTAYRIVLQMLDVYEFVHSCGYVHADLKASNILLGYGKGGGAQTYLVDYGLASHFTTKDFKPDPKKMHNGTIEYTSRDAHHGVATMRGDMEILGYNLIEWLGTSLPWVANKMTAPAKVQSAKEEFMANVGVNLKKLFPKDVPVPLADFMKYVAKLKYNEAPNYEHCRKLFSDALKKMKVSQSGDLDFKMKLATNNNELPHTSKGRGGKLHPRAALLCHSSTDEESAFEDDDGVEMNIIKKPTAAKVSPRRPLKTTPVKTPSRTTPKPLRKVSPIKTRTPKKPSSPTGKAAPAPSPRRRAHAIPNSPSSASPSPARKKRANVTPSASKNDAIMGTPQSTRHTPLSAKANVNFRSSGTSGPGKTIINDSLTPNPRSGKTYEFNFELDVSMDANVVVNVKRKKKAPPSRLASVSNSSAKTKPESSNMESEARPVRVKVRKLASDGEDGSDAASPRTPAVTVKKSRHLL